MKIQFSASWQFDSLAYADRRRSSSGGKKDIYKIDMWNGAKIRRKVIGKTVPLFSCAAIKNKTEGKNERC